MNHTNQAYQALEDSNSVISINSNIIKNEELIKYALKAFRDHGLNQLGKIIWDKGLGKIPVDKPEHCREAWFQEGLDCEILQPRSAGWQKGKVRFKVTLEFCAEELSDDTSLNSLQDLI